MAQKKKVFSLQPDVEPLLALNDLTAADFQAASEMEKENFISQRKSVSYWKDAWRRLRKNTVAMVAMCIIILLFIFAFIGPLFIPYSYEEFNAGAENLFPWHYTLAEQEQLGLMGTIEERIELAIAEARALAEAEGRTLSRVDEAKIKAQIKTAGSATSSAGSDLEILKNELGIKSHLFGYSVAELQRIAAGEKVFPHVFGTDNNGRDLLVRTMYGTRVSMTIGVCAAILVLVIGSLYGSISGYAGGTVDTVMQRIVDIIYSVPEVLVILLLSTTLNPHITEFINTHPGPFSSFMSTVGPNLIAMFISFGVLYWVGLSRIIRGQVLTIKQQEYVTAARALGASSGRIIKRHLLPNCIGQITVTTCLQIPSAIFLESFMSYLGVGVSAPLTSLGSMCRDALNGFQSYTYRLLIPAIIISVMILAFNLFGDGLRDALDPRLKK